MLGTVLDGRWRIRGELGRGGMSIVYLADDVPTGRRVAIKVLLEERTSGSYAERFRREMAALAAIDHPNVIRILQSGAVPDGRLYYAMELLEAPTLADQLDRDLSLTEARTLDLVRQLAGALGHLHARGIVHRDLKPANVGFRADGRPVLLDFGLARDLARTGVTTTGTVVGTPAYMPPEQLLGLTPDGRSDLYQLALVAYECLTGEPPFDDVSLEKIAPRILREAPAPPSKRRKGLSPAWDRLLLRCLAKERDKRPADAAALLLELERLCAPAAPAGAESGASEPVVPRAAAAPRRLPLLAAAAFLLALAVGLGASRLARPARDPELSGVQLEPVPGGVAVTWTTDEPCRSVVAAEERAGEELLVSAPAGAPLTRAHRLLVTGLTDGAPCTVRVVLPSGNRSLPWTGAAGRFAPTLSEVQRVPEGVRLVLETDPCAGLELLARAHGLPELTLRATRMTPRRWYATLPWFGGAVEAVDLNATLADGRATATSLQEVLRARTSRATSRLHTFHLREFAAGVATDLTTATARALESGQTPLAFTGELRRRRTELTSAAITRRVDLRALADDLAALRAVAPLAFGTRLLPWNDRLRLYHDVAEAVRLKVWLHRSKVEAPALSEPLPWLGTFSLDDAWPGPWRAQAELLPPGRRRPLVLGLAVPRGDGTLPEHRFQAAFELSGPAAAAGAALRLRVSAFGEFVLRVTVNATELVVADRPLFEHDGGKLRDLVQSLPAEGLRPGRNELRLEIEWPFDDLTSDVIELHELTLAVRAAPGAR